MDVANGFLQERKKERKKGMKKKEKRKAPDSSGCTSTEL